MSALRYFAKYLGYFDENATKSPSQCSHDGRERSLNVNKVTVKLSKAFNGSGKLDVSMYSGG